MSITDLEDLLAVDFPNTRSGRGMRTLLIDVSGALSAAPITYVLTGTMAYGLYARARFTRSIDILADGGDRTQVTALLDRPRLQVTADVDTGLSFVDPENGLVVNIAFANDTLLRTVLTDPARAIIFGVDTPVATHEHLACALFAEGTLSAITMAAELLTTGPLDLDALRRRLRSTGADQALVHLEHFASSPPSQAPTYAGSMRLRLARRP